MVVRFLTFYFGLLVCAAGASADRPDPYLVARQIDQLYRQDVATSEEHDAPTVGDESFLRRASLDLLGRPASPEEVTAFINDDRPDKRRAVVQRLLANSAFGKNWGQFWRDVIMYRCSEKRAFVIAGHHLSDFLASEVNRDQPWSHSVYQMITATGYTDDHGQAGFIVAQGGLPEEIAAEVSRVFLGIEIECAQCHDHPNGTWKREQFHHFAAFFPRVGAQLHREKLVFRVTTLDRELVRPPAGNMRFFGTYEHYLPDLENPASPGTLMQPEFFLTGQKFRTGTSDALRRSMIARWVTSPANLQFSKAFVNRMWSELVGTPLCSPIDDMSPKSRLLAPRTLDFLAQAFADSQYDVKWFYTTVMATAEYARESRERNSPETALKANCVKRLRAEQLLDSLISVLNLETIIPDPPETARPVERRAHVRFQFNEVFGFDPSIPREQVTVTIPQALLLMNSPLVHEAISAGRAEALGGLLASHPENREAVHALYGKILGRPPSDGELATCLEYLQEIPNRNEAFEDLLWVLLNTTEFPHRM